MGEARFLFGLGAQKAGTTWLYDYFRTHPEVHVPVVKEMHYFNVLYDPRQVGFLEERRQVVAVAGRQRWTNGDEAAQMQPGDPGDIEVMRALVDIHEAAGGDHGAYRQFVLEGAEGSAWVADITPDYSLLGPSNLMSMAQDFEGSKFLFIMRDPVDRLWSHINMHLGYVQRRGFQMTVDELLLDVVAGKHDHIMDRSNYAGSLFAQSHLPFSRVKTMFYETLFCDSAMLDLCNFLGVDFRAGDYARQVRRGRGPRMNEEQRAILRWLMAPVYRQVYAVFRNEIPLNWDMAAMDATRPDFLDVSKIAPKIIEKAG